MTVWIVLAFVIISALALYAGKLLLQLKQQTQANKLAEQQHQQALKQHDANILTSVEIIVKAMREQQCDLSEGCWRLSVLLDSLKTVSGLAAQFPAIYGLYNKIKDMAILNERKKLEKKQRMRDDYNRVLYEAEYQADIQQDLILLAEFTDSHLAQSKAH
jgi:uncharacterized protein DUF2489